MIEGSTPSLPRTREEARELLWAAVRRRLEDRRGQRIPLGATDALTVRFAPRRPGQGPHDTRRVGDIRLGGEGRLLLADMVGVWPDDLRGHETIMPVVLDEFHDLVRAGLLRPHPDGESFFITERGAMRLDAGDPLHPLDKSGRVEAFRREFAGAPHLDLMLRYLAEAVDAHTAGIPLAGATMIGCAYELAMLELAGAVARRWAPDASMIPGLDGDEKRAIRRIAASQPAAISHVEGAIFRALEHDRVKLGDHWDWAESGFRATFVLVRKLRNKAGHPTGARVAPDDVWTHILLLPGWYRHVRAIIGRL